MYTVQLLCQLPWLVPPTANFLGSICFLQSQKIPCFVQKYFIFVISWLEIPSIALHGDILYGHTLYGINVTQLCSYLHTT